MTLRELIKRPAGIAARPAFAVLIAVLVVSAGACGNRVAAPEVDPFRRPPDPPPDNPPTPPGWMRLTYPMVKQHQKSIPWCPSKEGCPAEIQIPPCRQSVLSTPPEGFVAGQVVTLVGEVGRAVNRNLTKSSCERVDGPMWFSARTGHTQVTVSPLVYDESKAAVSGVGCEGDSALDCCPLAVGQKVAIQGRLLRRVMDHREVVDPAMCLVAPAGEKETK